MRKTWLFIITLLVIGGITFFKVFPLYQQEGNPLPFITAATKLHIHQTKLEAVSTASETYLVRARDGIDPVVSLMESRGWQYREQMGAATVFTNQGELITVESRMYSRHYMVITIPTAENRTTKADSITINLVATGDILMHNTVIDSGKNGAEYNYDHLYAPVKHLITQADYASVNLECALAGPTSGYTGYPRFNSPDSIASALKEAGFDLIITANNHILDRGHQGAIRTMDTLNNAGLDTAGTYRSEAERNQFLIKNIRGVKVGYLAYSYSTNGIPVPPDKPYFFNFLDREQVLADIASLRPHVDVLVLVLHWGVEYSPYPTAQQRKLAAEFFQNGADVILGSHPHVIQPMEVMKVDGQDKFVIYSMGNSMGNQNGVERNSGVIINLEYTKDLVQGITTLTGISHTPTYIQPHYINGRRTFRVVPIEETIKAIQAGQDPYMGNESIELLQQVLTATNQTLNQSLE